MDLLTNGAIHQLLQPLDIDSFFDRYWEKLPVHIERNEEAYFSDLLNLDAIDSLIATSDLYYPDVQLIRQAEGIPSDHYTDGNKRILPLRLLEHHAAGATLTVARADAKIATVGAFCRQLQSQWQMQSHANLYLSPPGHQGFNPHYDSHDVFIIQISGNKRFNFYSNNVELPFNEAGFDAEYFVPGEKTEELTVSAGDTLYIPRGVTHDAIALDQSPSLHITLGVYPMTVRDLLQSLVQHAAEHDTRLRRSIPLVHRPGENTLLAADTGLTQTLLQEIVGDQLTDERIERILSDYQDQTALQCRQDSRGVLTNQHVPITISEAFVISVNAGMVFGIDLHLEDGQMMTVLRSPGQIVEFHEPMGTVVQWLVKHQRTAIKDIPTLDKDQKMALIDRLLRQNIITIDQPY